MKSSKNTKKKEYLFKYEDFQNSNSTWIDSKLVKKKISDDILCKLKLFIIKLDSLSHSNRLSYVKKLKSDKIYLISEIVSIFLDNNINTDI